MILPPTGGPPPKGAAVRGRMERKNPGALESQSRLTSLSLSLFVSLSLSPSLPLLLCSGARRMGRPHPPLCRAAPSRHFERMGLAIHLQFRGVAGAPSLPLSLSPSLPLSLPPSLPPSLPLSLSLSLSLSVSVSLSLYEGVDRATRFGVNGPGLLPRQQERKLSPTQRPER